MRRALLSILTLILASAPLVAAAKPRGCLTYAEIQTEQIVRQGVFLREASGLCEEYTPGTRQMWTEFDGRFGPQLAAQTAKRASIFQREFPKASKQMMTYFDGRLVTNYRRDWANPAMCANVMKMLKKNQKGGWSVFVAQSKWLQDNIRLDFTFCGQ